MLLTLAAFATVIVSQLPSALPAGAIGAVRSIEWLRLSGEAWGTWGAWGAAQQRRALPDLTVNGVVVLRPELPPRVRIRGGTFAMGSSPTDMVRAIMLCRREVLGNMCDQIAPRFRAEGVQHRVTLSTFEIDRTEVTVGEFRRCVATGTCRSPAFTSGDVRFNRPNLPVTHVTWDDASGYCAFKGGRLPTEAEWEFTARGEVGRDFPWGNVYNPHICNHGSLAADESDQTDGFIGLAPVGSFPSGKTREGVLDLAGNVSEWVSDFFHEDENGLGYEAIAVTNPKGSPLGAFHVLRGGSYGEGAVWMRTASRQVLISSTAGPRAGFRCAYDVK